MFNNKASIVMSIAAASVVMTTGIGYAAEKGVVTADSLNIRSGPSTSYSIKAKVAKGTVVNLGSKSSNGWYEVSLTNGITGWASGYYIDVIEEVSSQQGEITEATYLRKEAKWTTDKLALLNIGTEVEVISTDVNWTKVKYAGQMGYVGNDYIEVIKNESTDVEKPIAPEVSTKTGQIVSCDTYLRKEGNWNAEKLVVLKEGTKVEILSSDDNWTKVKYGNYIGYIGNSYIKEITNSVENEDELKEGEGRILEATYLRDSDNWSANKMMVLQPNTKVEIISRGINWTKVKYKENVGYIGNAYIEVCGSDNLDREAKIEAVINLAKAQIGKPYEWGAEGPNSFDCSGLMYYIFKNGAGVTLPRTSKDQAKVGSAVSYSNMQPGDIISFDFDKDGVVTHVGVYIGGGEFIHARKPGTLIEKTSITSTYWKNAIYNIRRVIE